MGQVNKTININPCNHDLIALQLGYIAHDLISAQRQKIGERQTQCPKCGLWLYKDEFPKIEQMTKEEIVGNLFPSLIDGQYMFTAKKNI